MITVKVKLDGVVKATAKRAAYARLITTQQVLKDSNRYAPFYEGNLIRSSLQASDPARGIIRWDTPYAHRLYINPQFNFSKDRNPLARGRWFDHAKTVHGKSWLKVAEGALNSGK